MELSKNVISILEALENAKKLVPLTKSDRQRFIDCGADFDVYLLELELGDYATFTKRLGISKSTFIPEPELDDVEIKALVDKILEVWDEFNYFVEFPQGLPLRIAYRKLLEMWDKEVRCFMMGSCRFDFYDDNLQQYVDLKADPETVFQAPVRFPF